MRKTTGRKRTASSLHDRDHERSDARPAALHKHSDEGIRQVLDLLPVAMLVMDARGYIAQVNTVAERLFGYARPELIDQPVELLVLDEGLRTAQAGFGDTSRSAPSGTMEIGRELRGRHKNGLEIPLETSVHCIDTATGPMALVSFTDISGRKRMQRELLARESELQSFLNGAPVLMWMIGPDWRAQLFNNAWLAFTGRSLEQEIAAEWTGEAIHPQDRPQCLADYRAAFATRRAFEHEYRLRRHDGEYRWLLEVGVPRIDATGTFHGYIGTCVDHTEQKRIETELRHVASGVAAAGEAVVMTGADGTIRYVNPAFTHITGYSSEDVVGRNPGMLKSGHHDAGFYREMWTQILAGQSWSGEVVNRRKNGTLYTARLTIAPVLGEDKNLEGFVGLQADVTEERRREQALREKSVELERSNLELEQFAYVASHDLQEPLRMVASYVQLLAKRYQDRLDADAHEFIGYAVDGATRMQELINDLLAYSRVQRKGRPLAPIPSERAFERACAQLQTAIAESGASVTADTLPEVMADEGQLVQLLQNLIGNAIKYHGEAPPQIRLHARRDGEKWQFSLTDNGIGIDPRYFERIFVLFQRLHTRAEYPGTGIGLAICKRIVERHGGSIWVESRPGHGTTFHFTLLPPGGGDEKPDG